jgi:hypothetical protein
MTPVAPRTSSSIVDYLLADVLVAVLDRQEWSFSFPTTMIFSRIDPLKELEKNF